MKNKILTILALSVFSITSCGKYSGLEIINGKSKADTKLEEENKAKAEIEAKVKSEAQAKLEIEAKAKAEVNAKIQANADAAAKLKAEANAKEDSDARAKLEAEAKAKAEVESKANIESQKLAKLEADAKAKIEADAQAKIAADAQAKIEADSKAKAASDAQAAADAKAAADAQAIADAKAKAEAQAIADAKAKAEAQAIADAKAAAEALAQRNLYKKSLTDVKILMRALETRLRDKYNTINVNNEGNWSSGHAEDVLSFLNGQRTASTDIYNGLINLKTSRPSNVDSKPFKAIEDYYNASVFDSRMTASRILIFEPMNGPFQFPIRTRQVLSGQAGKHGEDATFLDAEIAKL